MAGTGKAHLRPARDARLRIEDLVVEYPAGRGRVVHAVSGVSIDVLPGETVGLVGESGCGKSSVGRAVMQLPAPRSGSVVFDGVELTRLPREELRRTRLKLRMIFQDPLSSLNPRRRVGEIVVEPQAIWHEGDRDRRRSQAREILEVVGLDPDMAMRRRPHQFSGGQAQRISIARALMLEPGLIVCDEPVSALDVSVQASILNLLEDLKQRYGLTLLFIAHDLAVVKNISDRVAVMYLGKICEVARPEDLYRTPAHPYTRLLIDSIPEPVPVPAVRAGGGVSEPPSPIDPPSGCRFRTRCPLATERCAREEPEVREVAPGHFAACHHPLVGSAS